MRVVLPGVVGTDTSQLCLSGLGPVCNRFYRLDRYAKELRSPAGPRRRRKRTHAIGVHPLPSAVLFVWYLMATQAPAVTAKWKAPVSACGPLCAIFREGWHPFPTDNPGRSVRHLWAMLASESSLTGVNSMADLPVQERLRRTKRKAG